MSKNELQFLKDLEESDLSSLVFSHNDLNSNNIFILKEKITGNIEPK